MPDVPVDEIVAEHIALAEGDGRNAVHGKIGMVRAAGARGTRLRFSLPLVHGEGNLRIVVLERLAGLHEVVVHGRRNRDGSGRQGASVAVEVIGNLVPGNGLLLYEVLGAQQAVLFSGPDAEQDGAFGFGPGGSQQARGFHSHAYTLSVVRRAGGDIVGVQVTSHHHVFVRVLRALDLGQDVVVLHGAREEMVADVKFQLEVLPVDHLLLDNRVLVLVQDDIASRGQGVHGQVKAHGAVVEHLHGHLGRADEPGHAGVHHLPIHQDRPFFASGQVGGAGGVGLGAGVDGEPVRGAGFDEHPGALERPFDAVELPLVLGLQVHPAFLRTAGAGGIGGRAEVQREAVFGEHPAAPRPPVKPYADSNGFLYGYFQPPGAELLHNPVFGMVEHVRAHDASADVAGDVLGVLHGPVVGPAQLQHGPGHFVLCGESHGH